MKSLSCSEFHDVRQRATRGSPRLSGLHDRHNGLLSLEDVTTGSILKATPALVFARRGGRSAMTCRYRCGDACLHGAPCTSTSRYFGDVVMAGRQPSRPSKGAPPGQSFLLWEDSPGRPRRRRPESPDHIQSGAAEQHRRRGRPEQVRLQGHGEMMATPSFLRPRNSTSTTRPRGRRQSSSLALRLRHLHPLARRSKGRTRPLGRQPRNTPIASSCSATSTRRTTPEGPRADPDQAMAHRMSVVEVVRSKQRGAYRIGVRRGVQPPCDGSSPDAAHRAGRGPRLNSRPRPIRAERSF